MESDEQILFPPINKHSVISLVFGILTALSFCTGVMPIPFTGFICFPISFVLGLVAVIYGFVSLNKIKKQNESGKPMAWIGIIVGGLIFFCILSVILLFVSLFMLAPDSIQPILENYSI